MTESVTLAHIFPRKVWIENDLFGSKHVMVQHDDGQSAPFTYASFYYDWAYTSNSGTKADAEALARQLGATDPIECKSRGMPELRKP